MKLISSSSALVALAATTAAQKCTSEVPEKVAVAKGFVAKLFTTNVNFPRALQVDSNGNLLVLERGRGVSAFPIDDSPTGCLPSAGTKQMPVADTRLNHGFDLSPDGKTIYASSVSTVFSWDYDPKQAKSIGAPKTLVTGMSASDHTTRTILMSKKAPGLMLVSRGSSGNVDNKAKTISTGISQIRIFNVTNGKTYAYTDGEVLGWGLRNSIGVGEHPDGGIWSNENGADNVQYKGTDVHENNPGEEINYHGHLVGGDRSFYGKNYGYPNCGATWDTAGSASVLRTGTHFAPTGSSISDAACASKDYIAPRLTLPSHWAPIDLKFNSNGTVAYMTSRGSWNKRVPDGYQLFAIDFVNGQPKHEPTSKSAAITVLSNKNTGAACGSSPVETLGSFGGGKAKCFRPTGVAFDGKGRLFMASDATNEIYVIGRADGSSVDALQAVEPTV